MRIVGLLALGALLVGATFATPVNAGGGTAGGSCGYSRGSYGLNTLAPPPGRANVWTGFAQATYSGVTPGTSIKVMSYRSLGDGPGMESADVGSWGGTSDLEPPSYANGITATSSSGQIEFSFGLRGLSDLYMFRVISDGQDIGGFECAVVAN